MQIDSSTLHNPDPDYLRDLIQKSGLSQRECARKLGISYSTMRDYLSSSHASKAPYSVQAQLEGLSRQYNGYFIDMPEPINDITRIESLLDNQAYLREKDYGKFGEQYRLYLLFNRDIHIDDLSQIIDSLDLGAYQVTPMHVAGTIRLG